MARLIWITGLPGSGKTTLGAGITQHLRQSGVNVAHLDGDILREAISIKKGYDIDARLSFAKTYQAIAKVLILQEIWVVMSTVSMFEEIYKSNRSEFADYFEVYLDVDFETRISSKREELYSKVVDVPGISQNVTLPTNSDLVLKAKSSTDRSTWLNTLINSLNGEFK
jgi:adenylylsulfate kinase-like enzyme